MADMLPGVGSSRTSSARGLDGTGRRRAQARPPEPAEERGEKAYEPPQRHYVHVEGRRFDLSAPRGTYLNILV